MVDRKSILIADDEMTMVNTIKSYLDKDGFQVISAKEGSEVIEKFHKIRPSLVLLELDLKDISGDKVCEDIRKHSEVPIIMISERADEKSILKGFEVGIDDYVTKPFSPMQLLARINALLRRGKSVEDYYTKTYSFYNDDLTINIEKVEVRKGGNLVNLTQTEFNLLVAMLKHPYKAFSREELVGIIYGNGHNAYDRTIDCHIKNLRHKIESDLKSPKYILTVHGVGYRFGGN